MTDVVLFLRVSTSHQTTDNQEIELVELCKRRGWNIVEIYKETISGTKKNEDRKELTRMLGDMKKRYFTKIICYDLSRISRNMGELVKTLSLLDDYKISLFSWKQNLDTDDGGLGKMFFYFVGIFNEIETSLRKERQLTSINRLRTIKGFKYGGNELISNETKQQVLELRGQGLSYRKIKEQIPTISVSSIGNIITEKRV
jgi:DNA invertase Pin-like site-specific DNA recombinase